MNFVFKNPPLDLFHMVAAKLPNTNPMVVEESTTQNGPEEDRYIHSGS
ncbi:MAG: hypothetical protein ACR2JB_20275 [Bryobacteraceae bacterium]